MALEKMKLLGLAMMAGIGLIVFGILMAADFAITTVVQSFGLKPKVSLFELVAVSPRHWASSYGHRARQHC